MSSFFHIDCLRIRAVIGMAGEFLQADGAPPSCPILAIQGHVVPRPSALIRAVELRLQAVHSDGPRALTLLHLQEPPVDSSTTGMPWDFRKW